MTMVLRAAPALLVAEMKTTTTTTITPTMDHLLLQALPPVPPLGMLLLVVDGTGETAVTAMMTTRLMITPSPHASAASLKSKRRSKTSVLVASPAQSQGGLAAEAELDAAGVEVSIQTDRPAAEEAAVEAAVHTIAARNGNKPPLPLSSPVQSRHGAAAKNLAA